MAINPSPSEIAKLIFICTLSLLALFLGFFMNFWRVADQEWFSTFQRDDQSHIIGRMLKSHQDGVFSDGGLNGIVSLDGTPVYNTKDDLTESAIANQYAAYNKGLPFAAYTTYDSQIGGQGMFFSILDSLLNLPPQSKLSLFQAFTSFLSAATLTAIVLWFYLEFGLTVAIFALSSAVFSQWLVVFGRNLWWSLWAFYLPLAVVLHYLRLNRVQMNTRLHAFGTIVFISVFIKCVFNGYEYITSTLVMMVVPLVYYGVLDRLHGRKFLAGMLTAALSSCLAVLLSLLILCFQVASVKGTFSDGVHHIVFALEKRTHANPNDFPSSYSASLEAGTANVVMTYLKGIYFDPYQFICRYLPAMRYTRWLHKWRYSYLVALFTIISGAAYILRNKCGTEIEKRKQIALISATWFAMLAPLSWFIVFKAHSAMHTHMNYIVWQMPFTVFGCALCGVVVVRVLQKSPARDERKVVRVS